MVLIAQSFAPFPQPFVNMDGMVNVRRVYTSPSVGIKPHIVFRGADPINITEIGKKQLIGHQITTITDMRLDREPNLVLEIESVEWLYVSREEKLPEERSYKKIAEMLKRYERNPLQAFIILYTGILQSSGHAFKLFFTRLRDKPNQPVLIHCSAGKDRTGIAIAILLMILGVHDDDIIVDYSLSNIGLEPAMPRLIAQFEARNQAYKDNPKGLKNFLSAFPETMAATLVLVREVFGGAENYCKEYMELESTDIEIIRQNLLPVPPIPANAGNSHNAM